MVLALVLGCAPEAWAQTAVQISGRVTTLEEGGVSGARVQVTSEALVREVMTDPTGRYRLRVPAGSHSYVVSVEAPSLHPSTRVLTGPFDDGSETRVDFVLTRPPIVLPALRVHVPRLSASPGRWTPGSVDVSRGGSELRRRSMEPDDASDLAEASGGARSPGPDGGGISMSGQRPDQTRLTLDGATLESTVIPREAVGSIAVVTNTYDVARGQFTGGNVDVRTQAAGNEWGATVRFEGRHPWLQFGDAPGALRQRSAYAAVDAGGGGALIRDRLFAYAAATVRRTESPRPVLGGLDAEALQALGLSPDSVVRFLDLTRGLRPPMAGFLGNESSLGSGLLRVDAALSPRHSLMLRLNGQSSETVSSGSTLSVEGTGTRTQGTGYGFLAQFGSGGARLANEMKVHFSRATQAGLPYDSTAAGLVRVASESRDGEMALLRFAGSPRTPRDTDQRALELTDNLVFTTADQAHRLRVGAEVTIREYAASQRPDNGSFFFESLLDLQENRPARFARSLGAAGHQVESARAALFLGDHWKVGAAQLSYGVRAERSWYPGPRALDSLVISAFGGARIPSPWRLSPRAGFALPLAMPWDRGVRGTTIQGGVGEFVGALPLQVMGAALAETGVEDVTDLVCAGPAAPTPDWHAYRVGLGTAPTACAGGSSGFASRFPRATVFASNFGPPRVWRASLSAGGAASGVLDWRLEASFVRGVSQPVAFDRNLRDDAGFLNPAEGGRRVYVPAGAIDPETGVASLLASRRLPGLGTVREVTGGGRSEAVQLTAKAGKFFGLQGYGSINYSFTSARETIGPLDAPGGGESSTGDGPFRLDWAPSPYAPRHLFRTELTWRGSDWFSLDVVGRLSSGVRFTPMVAGDANGDGLSNDRAFVFDPRTESARSTQVAAQMEQFLGDALPSVRRCLAAQAGRVAAPGSCSTPWSAGLDLRAAFQAGPRLPDSPHKRATVWLVARNLPAALDYLLHGRGRSRGWGQLLVVDNTLLTVEGFDPAAGAFQYHVNPRFGRRLRSAGIRVPLVLSIQARVALGTDRAYRAFKDRLRANSGAEEVLTPENLRIHLLNQLPNVPAEVLARNAPARLYLTPAQAIRLQSAADSLFTRTTQVVEALVDAVLEPGGRYSGQRRERVRALSTEAAALRRSAVLETRSVLTPEQWNRLPDSLRAADVRIAPTPPERITMPSDW